MKQFECKDHPAIFLDNNIAELLAEDDCWSECTNNGCIHTELIIQKWRETFEPIDEIKAEKGAYSILKNFVNLNTVSGIFYRSTDYFEDDELEVGMNISYSNRLTSWSENIEEAWKWNGSNMFMLEANDIKGINISNRDENTFIFGDLNFQILSKDAYEDGNLITVKLV